MKTIKTTTLIYTLAVAIISGHAGAYLNNRYTVNNTTNGKANILALSQYIDSQN